MALIHYADKLHFGPASNDVHEGIDLARMRADRAARMRQVMKASGIPALLVTGAEHDPVVYAPAGSYHQMPDQAPWIPHWRIARSWMGGTVMEGAAEDEAKLFAEGILAELSARGLAAEPLAVSEFDTRAIEALKSRAVEVRPGLPLLMESSRIKTRDEISCLMMVASISTSGFQQAFSSLRPGVLQSKVAKDVKRAVEDAGAEFGASKVMAGPLGFERGISGSDRRLEYGDLAYVLTCGTSFLGYTACLYRQYVVGRAPTAQEKGWYTELRDRLDAVISELTPGRTTADAATHFAPASKFGYADEAELLTIEYAHGIGLVNVGSRFVHYNYPLINRQWSLQYPEEIEEGMVIAVEGIEGVHRQGGVRTESMVLVTADGPRLIDHFPRDEILVAGAI